MSLFLPQTKSYSLSSTLLAQVNVLFLKGPVRKTLRHLNPFDFRTESELFRLEKTFKVIEFNH